MKCVVCNTVLGKLKRRYCTTTCYDYRHNEIQKQKYKNRRPKLPIKPCVFCDTHFQPRDKRHICCDVVCRRLLENRKARESRIPKDKQKPKYKQKPKNKPATLYYCTHYREEELRDKPEKPELWEDRKKVHRRRSKKEEKAENLVVVRPLPLANSDYSGQIEEFEKNGGMIQVFPPQLNGRTPDVNITSVSGWSVETMFGYGYEIQLMEELNDAG